MRFVFSSEGFVGLFGKQFLAFLIAVIVTKSTALEFETNSNASQFVNLENLIGSLHKYAPGRARLFVRDTGLTKGQRILLKRYENIQIVSSAYEIPKSTRSIHSAHELIAINNTFIERQANGDLLHVDSIRKRFRLAVVIPFIRSQMSDLLVQLNMSIVYPPCKVRYDSVDLIFYHNEKPSSSLETAIRQTNYVNRCYHNILFLAANLAEHQDGYLHGSAVMWMKLLLEEEDRSVALRTYGYTHFFLMEPDTKPIRSLWLDSLIEQITDSCCGKVYCTTTWWMSGSIYRGSKLITGERFIHINGNAIYHLSSKFLTYVQLFSRTFLFKTNPPTGYDLSIFLFLFNNSNLAKQVWHKFRFSDFIQNCGRPSCVGDTQQEKNTFLFNNPDTYLIHGGPVHKEAESREYNDIKWIFLSCILLVLIILCRCRLCHRRLGVAWTRISCFLPRPIIKYG
jgi:hypothetical protein